MRADGVAVKKRSPSLKRYRLDVSAQFYPIISTKKAQSLFRLSAETDAVVDPELLREAAERVLERFPTFKVRLRRGWAWYYFEENTAKVKVFPSTGKILLPIDVKQTDGYLFRIAYGEREISLEEGYGAAYCEVEAAAVVGKAKQMGATFTALVCGALAYTVEKVSGGKRPIVIMVPVNLRTLFPSRTLRNFVNFVRLTFKPGENTSVADYVRSAADDSALVKGAGGEDRAFLPQIQADHDIQQCGQGVPAEGLRTAARAVQSERVQDLESQCRRGDAR